MGAFELRLRSNNLVGDLPQALSFLPLEVSLQPSMYDSCKSQMAPSLNFVDQGYYRNLLTPITDLIQWLDVQVIDVGANNLTGGVDTLLSNTPFLRIFHVDGNHLEGTIPNDFATFSLRVQLIL